MKCKWQINLFQLLVLLLSTVTCIWMLQVYFNLSVWVICVPVVCIQYLSLIFFEVIKDRGYRTTIYYGVYVTVVGAIIFSLNSFSTYVQTYMEWLVVMEFSLIKDISYLISSVILIATIGVSIMYYFTIVRFRPMFLILIGCMPAAVCIRVGTQIVGLEFILFMICFLGIYMVESIYHIEDGEEVKVIHSDRKYGLAISIYIGVTVLAFTIVPRPNFNITNPLAEILKNTMPEKFSNYNTSTLPSSISATSIPEELGEEILFEITGEPPKYLKTRGWDGYKDNRWYIAKEGFDLGYKIPLQEKKRDLYNKTYKIFEIIEELYKAELLIEYPEIEELLQHPKSEIIVRTISVTPQDYPSRMYLNPSGMLEVVGEENVYVDESGTAFSEDSSKPTATDPYTIVYEENNIRGGSRESNLISSLTIEGYEKLIQTLLELNREGELESFTQNLRLLRGCEQEIELALEYFVELPPSITAKTYELAEEITKGYTSIYDKAKAIENYFYTNEFTYDLQAPSTPRGKDAVEYFLFETKKGACVQFASSMTILCRAAGIPAILTEGYVCEEYDTNVRKYIIRQKHAHAFPQVYIPGYGWMIFEPTVGTSEEATPNQILIDYLTEVKASIETQSVLQKLGMAIKLGLMIVGIIVVILVIRVTYEKIWRLRVIFRKSNTAIIEIYERLLKKLKKKGYQVEDYETPLTISRSLLEEEIDLRWLSDLYNHTHYGGHIPTKEEVKQALKTYKEINKKKYKKKCKKSYKIDYKR